MVAILVLLVLALSAATFAWYTVSTAPEISQLKVSMVTTANFEIARATKLDESGKAIEPPTVGINDLEKYGDTSWGQTISFTNANLFVEGPSTLGTFGDDNMLGTVIFDETGRTKGLTVLNKTDMGSGLPPENRYINRNSTTGVFSALEQDATNNDVVDPQSGLVYYYNDKGEVLAVGLCFFVRTNMEGVTLSIHADGISAIRKDNVELDPEAVGVGFRFNGGDIVEPTRDPSDRSKLDITIASTEDGTIKPGEARLVEMILYVEGGQTEAGFRGAVAEDMGVGVDINVDSSKVSDDKGLIKRD